PRRVPSALAGRGQPVPGRKVRRTVRSASCPAGVSQSAAGVVQRSEKLRPPPRRTPRPRVRTRLPPAVEYHAMSAAARPWYVRARTAPTRPYPAVRLRFGSASSRHPAAAPGPTRPPAVPASVRGSPAAPNVARWAPSAAGVVDSRSQPAGSATENPSGARSTRNPAGSPPVAEGDGFAVVGGADGEAVSPFPPSGAPPGAGEGSGADGAAEVAAGGAAGGAAVDVPPPASPCVATSTATAKGTTARVVPRTTVRRLPSRPAYRTAAKPRPRSRGRGTAAVPAPGSSLRTRVRASRTTCRVRRSRE